MVRTRSFRLGLLGLGLALLGGLWALSTYYMDLPQHVGAPETLVLGQDRFAPGSLAALRVIVRNRLDAAPLADAHVTVALQPAGGTAHPVFSGVTDPQGTTQVAFTIPADAPTSATLIVNTTVRGGTTHIERPITLERSYRVLLSSDKPLYQPGQTIHLRALALSSGDRRPAQNQALELVIADGKGNKVFRQTLTTSAFGVAAADFPLAAQVNTGAYKITANLGDTASEKTVTVAPYVLPKFAVKLTTERPFYLPGAHVRGTLQARYFFGKPVAGGAVRLGGTSFDVAGQEVVSLQGTTAADGSYAFEFDLPRYMAGSDLDAGGTRLALQADVTDQTDHTERGTLDLPVAASPLVIDAVPEGGQWHAGVDNILYVLARTPDGAPADATVAATFDGQSQTAQTGKYGVAELHFTPQRLGSPLIITARDNTGAEARRELSTGGTAASDTVLLRPDRPAYRVGDTMRLTVLTTQSTGTAYLDIVRDGQTISTRAAALERGQAQIAVDLTPDQVGTLELHAYLIRADGQIIRDTRLVLVDSAANLGLTLTPNQATYRPGDTAGLDVAVRGLDGQGTEAALGLAVVDESVFALAEQDPGFAKLYFLLEQELLTPKYELHGFRVPDLNAPPVSDPAQRGAQDAIGSAALAQAPSAATFDLQANSYDEGVRQATAEQQRYFTTLSDALTWLLVGLPLLMIALSAIAAYREEVLTNSVALTIVGLILGVPGAALILAGLLQMVPGLLLPLLAVGVLLALLCAVLLIGYMQRQGDRALLAIFGLFGVYLLVWLMLPGAQAHADGAARFGIGGWQLLSTALLPLGLGLRAASLAASGRGRPALLSLAGGLLLLGLPLLVGYGPMGAAMSAPLSNALLTNQMQMSPHIALGRAAAAPTTTTAAAAPMPATGSAPKADEQPSTAPPRLRQYFPETMLWLPDAMTDQAGHLHLDVPVADSITTWRITALASTQDGRLGSATAPLRVFQDFFIDLDLPQALTVGDEVSVPVGVFNYLADAQTVRLTMDQADWFELRDSGSKEITIAANDIGVVYFRVRARTHGSHALKVTAQGSKLSDAIQKDVQVFPNGKPILTTHGDSLDGQTPAHETIAIPAAAIPGTARLTVKLYPGALSQAVEGLDSILRMPNGCFEQTSSTTYPNVLVLDYLKTTQQAAPEIQLKAEQYINLGYQRLTTFEVPGGGFSLFGTAPGDPLLTAYGLQEFSDMSRVHAVDPALVRRTAEWLLTQQQDDGSWQQQAGFHESNLTNQTAPLPVTAYIIWSLVDSGFAQDLRTARGLDYLRQHWSESDDPYALGLVANALVAADGQAKQGASGTTQAVLDRLATLVHRDGKDVTWQSTGGTFMGGGGATGDVETTALVTLAFLRAGQHSDLAQAALGTLVRQKDSFGTWYSTSATVMALKALLQSARGSTTADATVMVTLNGGTARTVRITPENADMVHQVTFDDLRPGTTNQVEVRLAGKGTLLYQATSEYYVPWTEPVGQAPPAPDPVTIHVTYDRTQMAVNDMVTATVTVQLNAPGAAEQALIDLGVPPGFAVQTADLDALVAQQAQAGSAGPVVARYELTGRQVLVYLRNLPAGQPLTFHYRLQARFPLMAQTPASQAYDYYNPTVTGHDAPQQLVVQP